MRSRNYYATILPPKLHVAYKIAALAVLIVCTCFGIRCLYIGLLCILSLELVAGITAFFTAKRPALRTAGLTPSARPQGHVGRVLGVWALAFLLCVAVRFTPWGQRLIVVLSLLAYMLDVGFMHVYCPFRRLALRNRCCATCRIYHLRYPMLVTGIILMPDIAAWIVSILSLALFVAWEYEYARLHIRLNDTGVLAGCRCGQYSSCTGCRENRAVKGGW